jgi:hypothetical protein
MIYVIKMLTSESMSTISTENGKLFLLKSLTAHNLRTFALKHQDDLEEFISKMF